MAASVAIAENSRLGGILPGPNPSDGSPSVQPGTWTFSMHGNCPHCHHQHTAVQVDLDLTTDPSHVSHVNCERCNRQWLAFTHDNSTRISLLSATTTEPDAMEEEVRQHLIGIVRRATTGSNMSDLDDGVSGPRPEADRNTLRTNTELSSIPEDSVPLTRSRSQQLLKRVRRTRDTHLPTLRRSNFGRLFGKAGPSNDSARRQQASVARILATANSSGGVMNQSSPPGDDNTEVASTQPNTGDMASLLPGLDTSTLQGMSRLERQNWARRQFTGFQRRTRAPRLGLSAVQSIQNEQYRRQFRPQSFEVGHAGGVAEVARRILLPHAASIGVIDPRSFETMDAGLSFPHLQSIPLFNARRPVSLPNLIRLPPLFPHLQSARTAHDSLGWVSDNLSRHSSMVAYSISSSQATTQASGPESVADTDLFHEAVEREQRAADDAEAQSFESRSSEDTLRELTQPGLQH